MDNNLQPACDDPMEIIAAAAAGGPSNAISGRPDGLPGEPEDDPEDDEADGTFLLTIPFRIESDLFKVSLLLKYFTMRVSRCR